VVFVDNKFSSIDILRENLARCGFEKNFEIIQCDALQAIATLSNRQRKFEYIFLDPPYNSDLLQESLEAISKGDLLQSNASILVEHSAKKQVPEKFAGLINHREYKFGDTVINLFRCIEV